MTYTRTFHISAAHFNDAGYGFWTRAQGFAGQERWDEAYGALLSAARESHGHNFVIICAVTGTVPEGASWLVDDVKLTEAVEGWFRNHLSLHPGMVSRQQRATTENLVERLIDLVAPLCAPGSVVEMEVQETPSVKAFSVRRING